MLWIGSGIATLFAMADGMPVVAGLFALLIIFFLARYSLNHEKAGALIKKDFGKVGTMISRVFGNVWKLVTRTFRNLLTVGRMLMFGGV